MEKGPILERLTAMREFVRQLRRYQAASFEEFLSDPTLRAAVERFFQLAIEAVLDISAMLCRALGLRRPGEGRESIIALGRAGVLPMDFAERFAPVASFRNILVHEYLRIDPKIVYEKLQTGLGDFEEFARHVARALRGKEK